MPRPPSRATLREKRSRKEVPRPPRTVVISGVNAGIGRRAAQALADGGHRVVVVARHPHRGAAAVDEIRAETGNPEVLLEVADVSDQGSVRALADRLHRRFPHLDALVNDAAVFGQTARRELTDDGQERFWATNHLGPFLLTALLSDLLLLGDRRVVTIASKGLVTTPRITLRYEETDGEGWFTPARAYYHSKLAQVMFATVLARRFPAGELLSVALRVPAVRLDPERLTALPPRLRWASAPKNRFAADPEDLASVYLRLSVGPCDVVAPLHAGYVDEKLRPVPMPRFARRQPEQDRLWELSSQQTQWPVWPSPSVAGADDTAGAEGGGRGDPA